MGLTATLTLTHPLVAIPLAIAASLGAWQVIWKKGLVPAYHFVRRVVLTLDTIAEEFKPNGGGSMRDAIDSKAEKADVLRIENRVIEAVRIGNANNEALASYALTLDEHLKLPSWHDDRDAVLARLAVMEDRQQRIVDGVVKVLAPVESAGGAFGTLVEGIIDALDHANGDEDVER